MYVSRCVTCGSIITDSLANIKSKGQKWKNIFWAGGSGEGGEVGCRYSFK